MDPLSPAPVSQVASSGQSHQTALHPHPNSCCPNPGAQISRLIASRLTQSLQEPQLVPPYYPPPHHGSNPTWAVDSWRTRHYPNNILRSPWRLLPTTMRPSLSRMSLRSVVSASTAIISEATEMSKAVSRVIPFSLGPCKRTLYMLCLSTTALIEGGSADAARAAHDRSCASERG